MLDQNNVVVVNYTVFTIVVDFTCNAAALTVILQDHSWWSLLFCFFGGMCSGLWFKIVWTKYHK